MSITLIGRMLGPYRFDELIGEGAFAEVYRCYQPSMERVVAVKVLDDRLAREPRFTERFQQEAEVAVSLHHPNIVHAFDFKKLDGHHCIAMDFVDGLSLRQVLTQQGAYGIRSADETATRLHEETENESTVLRELTRHYQRLELGAIAQVTVDLCAALTYAHDQQVIHRDVKPDNVLISRDGQVLLGDFGIARLEEESRTRTGLRIGTVAYMSPEQIRGQKTIDGRSDIYSLGVVLYELITGIVPFVGNDTAVWQMHLRSEPLPPRTLREDLPEGLQEIVLKCLAKEPTDRYQNAKDVSGAVSQLARPTSLTAWFADAQPDKTAPELPVREKETGICPRCGYGVSGETREATCPSCGQLVSATSGQAVREQNAKAAASFIHQFRLSTDLSLDVRVYEFGRTIAPRLNEMKPPVLGAWEAALAHGSFVSPVSAPEERPEEAQLLGATKGLLDLANLWDSEAVGAYVKSPDARRTRRGQVAELRSRAYQLIGLNHSRRGAQGTTNAQMVAAYTEARSWYQKAQELAQQGVPELVLTLTLAVQLTDRALAFAANPEAAEDRPEPELQITAESSSRNPGLKEDLAVWRDYQGAHGRSHRRIESARVETQRLLKQARDHLTDCSGQLRELAVSAQAEQLRVTQRCEEISAGYHRDLGWFAKLAQFARIGVLVGPLALALLGALLITTAKPGLDWGIALLVSCGTLVLPAALGYLGAALLGSKSVGTAFNLGPGLGAILGLWSIIAMDVWYVAVGSSSTQAGVTTQMIGISAVVFVILLAFWAGVVLGFGKELGGKLWIAFVTVVCAATFIVLGGYTITTWLWLSTYAVWMIAGAVLMLLLGIAAAYSVAAMSDAEALAQQRFTRALETLQAQSMQTLTRIQAGHDEVVGEHNRSLNEIRTKTSGLIENLQRESEALSMRSMRSISAEAIAQAESLYQGLGALETGRLDLLEPSTKTLASVVEQTEQYLATQMRSVPQSASPTRSSSSETEARKPIGAFSFIATIVLLWIIMLWALYGWALIPHDTQPPAVSLMVARGWMGAVQQSFGGPPSDALDPLLPRTRAAIDATPSMSTPGSPDLYSTAVVISHPLTGSLTSTPIVRTGMVAAETISVTRAPTTSGAGVTPAIASAGTSVPMGSTAPLELGRVFIQTAQVQLGSVPSNLATSLPILATQVVGSLQPAPIPGTPKESLGSAALRTAGALLQTVQVQGGTVQAKLAADIPVQATQIALRLQPATAPSTPTSASPTRRPTATATVIASPTASATTPPAVLGEVIVDQANARQGPGLAYPTVAVLALGTQMRVVGRNTAGDWWKVCCVGGREVWIADAVVRVQGIRQAVPEVTGPPPPPTVTRLPSTPTPKPVSAPVVASNVRDFGGGQGGGGWRYQIEEGRNSGKFSDFRTFAEYPASGAQGARRCWLTSQEGHVRICENGELHPGATGRVAYRWQSNRERTVRVEVHAHKVDTTCGNNDGVWVGVFRVPQGASPEKVGEFAIGGAENRDRPNNTRQYSMVLRGGDAVMVMVDIASTSACDMTRLYIDVF